MSEAHDEDLVAEKEWSSILGQTNEFLGRVQELIKEETQGGISKEAPPKEIDDLVTAFPRSLQEILVSYEISGRAMSRARATYGDIKDTRLRLLSFSGATPEIVFDQRIAIPGQGIKECSLEKSCAFLLVAVGVLDERGVFYPVAHAPLLSLQPAALYPKGPPPSLWIDSSKQSKPEAEKEDLSEKPLLETSFEETNPLSSHSSFS